MSSQRPDLLILYTIIPIDRANANTVILGSDLELHRTSDKFLAKFSPHYLQYDIECKPLYVCMNTVDKYLKHIFEDLNMNSGCM